MKAVTSVCSASANVVANGRVNRPRRDVENEEIQMYISKLKELVPFMPRNRKLSKLEVIQYVIDYICDLQYALESHPVAAAVHAPTTTTTTTLTTSPRQVSMTSAQRQPLGVLASNTIVSCASQEHVVTTPVHVEKVLPADSRPVSC